MTNRISGIHHVTAITADGQKNIDFYTGLLGLRLVKVTVNFDDPQSYHLYYGDERGHPGTIMTFFVWPGGHRGRQGSSQVVATSFSIPPSSMKFWRKRIIAGGSSVDEAPSRFGEQVLSFNDPDGIRLEMVARPSEGSHAWKAGPVPAEHAIHGFHGVTLSEEGYEHTAELLTRTLGFRSMEQRENRFRFTGAAATAEIVDLLCMPDSARGMLGTGIVHHVAFRSADLDAQRQWRQVLVDHKQNVTPVIDRTYFQSIYFREPGGVLFEIATDGPGFTVDESPESLGTSLMLPKQYEKARPQLESLLPRLRLTREPKG